MVAYLQTGAACYPHADKLQDGQRSRIQREFGTGGEDAYFVVNDRQTDVGGVVGVADGVGGWRKYGIDAGEWSRSLMLAAQSHVKGEGQSREPLAILEAAFKETVAQEKGSSTACVFSLDGTKVRLGIELIPITSKHHYRLTISVWARFPEG